MIRVIVSDMDGTLLGTDHKLNCRTTEAIKKACEEGIRFMIATGRSFEGAMKELKQADIVCDYIVSSGAELRDSQKNIIFSSAMKSEDYVNVYNVLQKYDISFIFCTVEADYCIGTRDVLKKNLFEHIITFDNNIVAEEIEENEYYKRMADRTKLVPDILSLLKLNPKVTKVFVFSNNLGMLDEIKAELSKNSNLAISSSFSNNLEVTDVSAQKGPVVKMYIEKLGYTMDEVMVIGDSLNDYSMLSMDFGATVAMGNAHPQIKKVAKYVTKSNAEDGVAYLIEMLLKRRV